MTAPARKARKSSVWARAANDWYVEPEDCATALARAEPLHGNTWDPWCGQGNVIRGLAAAGVQRRVVGTDLVQRVSAPWFAGVYDFKSDDPLPVRRPRNIVGNPPYGGAKIAEEAVRWAVTVATEKVIVFVSARFLFSETRAGGLFVELPPTKVYHLVPRPSVPPGEYLLAGNKAEGGTGDFVWIVWDVTGQRPPEGPGWLQRKAGAP